MFKKFTLKNVTTNIIVYDSNPDSWLAKEQKSQLRFGDKAVTALER
jgi:hypothetical protein